MSNNATFYFSLRILSTSRADVTFRRTLVIYWVSESASKQDATTLKNTKLWIRQEPQKLKEIVMTNAKFKIRALAMFSFGYFDP